MYKDKSPTDETDEDVELIAEVGYIASRVRVLEQTFFGCFEPGFDAEYESDLGSGGGGSADEGWTSCLGTANCGDGDGNGSECVVSCQQPRSLRIESAAKRRRLLEELLIKFYEDRERAKDTQPLEGAAMSKSSEKAIDEKKHNESGSSSGSSGCSGTKSVSIVDGARNNEKQATVNSSSGNGQITEAGQLDEKNKDNNEENVDARKNDVNEVVLRSEGNAVKNTPAIVLSVKKFGDSGDSSSSSGGTEGLKVEYRLIRHEQSIVQCQFDEEDLRAVVKDLKRKVEYTERMNWLRK